MTKRQRANELVQVCVAKYDKLLPEHAKRLALSDHDADALDVMNEMLAVKILDRAALFAENRTKVKGYKRMRRAKVALTLEDLQFAWRTVDE